MVQRRGIGVITEPAQAQHGLPEAGQRPGPGAGAASHDLPGASTEADARGEKSLGRIPCLILLRSPERSRSISGTWSWRSAATWRVSEND